LVASFVLAARSIGLSDAQGREAAVTCARSYRKRLRMLSKMHPLQVWYQRIDAEELIEAYSRERRGTGA